MNPVLLGSLAALCWGTLDFLAGKVSRAMGCLQDVLARDPDNTRGRTLLEQVQKTAANRRPA